MKVLKRMIVGFLISIFSLTSYKLYAGEVIHPPESISQEDSDRGVDYEYEEVIAKAIVASYKNINLQEAKKVVRVVYKETEGDFAITPSLLIGVIATESGFRRNAISKEGAMGYTQVNVKYHKHKFNGKNVFDTEENIRVGVSILRDCFEKYNSRSKALGCYNGSVKSNKFANTVLKKSMDVMRLVYS